MTGAAADPRQSSHYLDDDLYEALIGETTAGRGVPDAPEATPRVAAFLAYEARLLDEGRFDEWVELFAPECLYWVPATVPAADPRRTVSVTLDDRRRLLDRVARLKTGLAYSQVPPSRTARVLGTTEVWRAARGGDLIARTPFSLTETRMGRAQHLAGTLEHVLLDGATLLVAQKRVHLLTADHPLGNVSFPL